MPKDCELVVIGAGPAGLAAAFYLLQKGHECKLYDAHPLPGGMLRYGIPAYRLPKDVLDAEIQNILDLARKHRVEPETLMSLHKKLQKELDDIDHVDERLEELSARHIELEEKYLLNHLPESGILSIEKKVITNLLKKVMIR